MAKLATEKCPRTSLTEWLMMGLSSIHINCSYTAIHISFPVKFLALKWPFTGECVNHIDGGVLKCDNSNSTLTVRSGFDLHRFFQVLVKENRKRSCQPRQPGSSTQESIVLTITPWLLETTLSFLSI